MKRLALVCILLLLALPAFTESPQVSLPGVNNQFDEGTIKKLVDVERQRTVTPKEDSIKDMEIEIKILQDFSTYVHALDNASKALYDYQSPFRDMLGTSSDEKILQAIAQRTAEKNIYTIQVQQVAKPDSFMSDSVVRNRNFSPCQFTITIGEKTYPVTFPGGSIAQLEAAIKKATEGAVETRIVNDTQDTSVLAINCVATGEKNKMVFGGNPLALYEIGMLMQSTERSTENRIAANRILSQNPVSILADAVKAILKPGNAGYYDLSSDNISVEANTSFNFDVALNVYPANAPAVTPQNLLPNMDIRLMQNILISNVTIQGGRVIPFYQEHLEPARTTVVSNFVNVMSILFDDGTVKTVSIASNGAYSVPMGLYAGKKVVKITLRNDNTERDYSVGNMRFTTKVSEGGVQPKNPISRACDAILTVDGVRTIRDNNNIDDLIKGVVLYLKKASPDDVTVTIDNNYDSVQKSILDWVNAYNQVMEYLAILTTPNQDTTPLHLREEANQKNGIYQAESSFTMLRSKLRTIAMNAYPTDLGRDLCMLETIGIFTKRAGNLDFHSEDWQSTQMGLLKIDTTILDKALKEHFKAVEQLFANDTDGDIVRDNGVAYGINQTLRIALGPQGFIENKIKSTSDKIDQTKKEIALANERLADYESDLRRRYGQANSTINQTQAQQRWLNSQFQNRQ